MLSYTFINSHSQVSDPVPNDPLVILNFHFFLYKMRKKSVDFSKSVSQMFIFKCPKIFPLFFSGPFFSNNGKKKISIKELSC